MCFPFQVLPAPGDGQPEGYWDDVPQPVEGVAERGIPQDARLNSPRHGMEGYHPLVLGVSNSGIRPSLINDAWSTGSCGRRGPVRIPQCRISPRHPSTRTSQCSGELQFRFLI